jgi:hypothetical protein
MQQTPELQDDALTEEDWELELLEPFKKVTLLGQQKGCKVVPFLNRNKLNFPTGTKALFILIEIT